MEKVILQSLGLAQEEVPPVIPKAPPVNIAAPQPVCQRSLKLFLLLLLKSVQEEKVKLMNWRRIIIAAMEVAHLLW